MKQSQEKLLSLDNIRRELARKDYASYVEYVHNGRWIPARHLLFVCQRVQQFIEAQTTNPYDILILQMPPQHGKSQSITETLPSWYLGKWPNKRVIEISYNDDFAQLFGRRNRNKLIEFGKLLFDQELARKPNSDTEFEMSNNIGGMISRGVMSGITGRPGDLMIIDDPIKNRQEADSETYRKRLWDEWQNSFKTRLSAGAKVIVIQTRWHEADLAGMITANEENVTVINLPCEAEENDALAREKGDPLFPEIGKNAAWLEQFKRSYVNDPTVEGGGNRAWLALFQGRPSAQEGNMLKRHWWRYWKPKGVDLPPVTVRLPNGDFTNIEATEIPDSFDRMLQSWDMTFKDTDGTDLVAGGVWAAKGASIYKLDLMYDRMDFVATLQAFLTMTDKWPQVSLKLVEDKANGPAIISMLRLKIGGIVPVLPEGSKTARASAVSPLIEAGNVYLPHPLIAGWVNSFIDQCANFPNGVNDDLVDEMSQALKRFMYAKDEESQVKLPANMNPQLKRDLMQDPAALAHWLATHPERAGERN